MYILLFYWIDFLFIFLLILTTDKSTKKIMEAAKKRFFLVAGPLKEGGGLRAWPLRQKTLEAGPLKKDRFLRLP